MVEIVELPKLGLSDYGELVTWEADEGDRVEAGDVIAVIESDKASAEIEAPVAGVVLATYVAAGETIAIEPGRPIAAIGEPDETPPSYADLTGDERTSTDRGDDRQPEAAESTASEPEAPAAQPEKVSPRARRAAAEHDVALAAVDRATGPEGSIVEADVLAHAETAETAETGGDAGTLEEASKGARRVARRHGVSLDAIDTGSGPGGAIMKSDVQAHVMARERGEAPSTDGYRSMETTGATDLVSDELTVADRRELSGTRRVIADRLSQSAREKPHVMGTREISVSQLNRARRRLREEYGVDVSVMDLVIVSVAETLEEFPAFNGHFVDGEHRLVDEVNVGYAVDGPNGLVVPVLRDVPNRSPAEVAAERRELVDAVLSDDHTVEDLMDGTFTVTNVGTLGMDVSYSIINPPQVAILAVGREKPAPVERDGEVEMEAVMTFSLTIDHRVLDGADSGRFLERLAEKLEYPGGIFDAVR